MGLLNLLRGLCASSNVLYMVGWLLALIGLSLTQDWCRSNLSDVNGEDSMGINIMFPYLSATAGKKCSKLFGFPWYGSGRRLGSCKHVTMS
jgi:hypothetical protein